MTTRPKPCTPHPAPLTREAFLRQVEKVQRTAQPPSKYLSDKMASEAGLPAPIGGDRIPEGE
jgi:hypothetical protein